MPRAKPRPAAAEPRPRPDLEAALLRAFTADFDAHGAAVIAAIRADDPTAYLKAAMAILPKELPRPENPLGGASDAELAALARELAKLRGG